MCTLLERFDEHDGKYIQYSKKYTLVMIKEGCSKSKDKTFYPAKRSIDHCLNCEFLMKVDKCTSKCL